MKDTCYGGSMICVQVAAGQPGGSSVVFEADDNGSVGAKER